MPRRSAALFACPALAFAIVLAFGAAAAPAECLVAPRGPTPEGQHWFYRTDHATSQKCWYLRAREVETTGTTASQQSARSDGAASDSAAAPLSKSEQDALFQDFLRWRKQHGEKP